MSRRRPGLFRGSELPRFVILAAIALAGWPLVLLFAQSQDEARPAPPPQVPAERIKPVVADDGIEFQAIVDKAPMQIRENAAYSILLDRARQTPAAELAAESRRDLLFTHLWERPERYRGVPVHLEGTALRVLTYEVNPALAPSGRIYEAWVYSDENRAFPYVLAFDEPPPGLVVGPDLYLKVRFDGYFLKLLGYRAGDKPRAAPMLVGRLQVQAAPAAAPGPMVELRELSRRNGFLVVFVLLFGYITFRAVFQIRRALSPTRRSVVGPERTLTPSEIAPEDLAEWLASLPTTEPDDNSVTPRISDRDRLDRP